MVRRGTFALVAHDCHTAAAECSHRAEDSLKARYASLMLVPYSRKGAKAAHVPMRIYRLAKRQTLKLLLELSTDSGQHSDHPRLASSSGPYRYP